jgi:hypothetical protein
MNFETVFTIFVRVNYSHQSFDYLNVVYGPPSSN